MLKHLVALVNFFLHPDEKIRDTKIEDIMHKFTLTFKKPKMEEAYTLKEQKRIIILFRLQFLLHAFINFTYFINNQFFLHNQKVAIYRICFTVWHLLLIFIQAGCSRIQYQLFISLSEFFSCLISTLISLEYIEAQLINKSCVSATVNQALNGGVWQGIIIVSYLLICPNWIIQSLMLIGTILMFVGLLGNLLSIYWTFYFVLIMMTLFFRLMEYYRRLDFFLICQQTSNLHACKNIFDKTVPNSILILSDTPVPESSEKEIKVLYSNDFARKYLNAQNEEEIVQKLKCIFVYHDSESDIEELRSTQSIYDVVWEKIQQTEGSLFSKPSQSMILRNEYDLSDQSQLFLCFKFESTAEVQIPVKGKIKSHFEIRVLSCRWENKYSYLVIMNDISEKIRLKHMKELDQYKDRLLATVSHDLKTPLNGMMIDISLMQSILSQRSSVTRDQISELCNHLDEFNQSGNLLLSMINDLLDYSQINKGQLRLTPKCFNLNGTFKFIAQLLNRQAREKNVQLIVTNQVPAKVQLLNNDENRLKQVLINLVANAIKFTMEGSINVIANYLESMDQIEIEVIDTGYGIPEEVQKNLFRLYSTFDLGNNNRHGIGLGLTISQQLVNLLGPEQKIELKSQVGKGSSFRFRIFRMLQQSIDNSLVDLDFITQKHSIPFFPKSNHQIKSTQSPCLASTAKHTKSKTYQQLMDSSVSDEVHIKKRILIVDDTPFNIIALSAMIMKVVDCQIFKAFNGYQALEILKSELIDLIFMDINMPGMDGYECTQQIRKSELQERKQSIAIVVVSAYTGVEDKVKSVKCGANDHLDKPLAMEEIKRILKKHKILEKFSEQ